MNTIPGLSFDEDLHEYRMLGKRVPSVTEILSPLSNFGMIAQADLEYASERGKAAHAACSLALTGDLDESSVDPAVAPYLEAFRAFIKVTGFLFVASEVQVYHRTRRYAGTVDLLGTFPPSRGTGIPALILIDLKTTAALSKTVGLQLAGYAAAIDSHHKPGWKDRIESRYALRLLPDGSYKLVAFNNPDEAACFDAFHSIFKWRQAR